MKDPQGRGAPVAALSPGRPPPTPSPAGRCSAWRVLSVLHTRAPSRASLGPSGVPWPEGSVMGAPPAHPASPASSEVAGPRCHWLSSPLPLRGLPLAAPRRHPCARLSHLTGCSKVPVSRCAPRGSLGLHLARALAGGEGRGRGRRSRAKGCAALGTSPHGAQAVPVQEPGVSSRVRASPAPREDAETQRAVWLCSIF